MREQRIVWPSLALLIAVVLLSFGADECPPPDPEIVAGTDCWATDPDQTVWRPKSAIPAGFFSGEGDPRSNAIPPPQFPADFQLRGEPLTPDEVRDCGCPEEVETTVTWLDRHGRPTDDIRHKVDEVVEETTVVDTCVHRQQNAKFKGQGAAVKVDIELRQLSLVSVQPLQVNYQGGSSKLFDAYVTESGTQNTGTLTFTANKIQNGKADGNVDLGSLPVHFEVVFKAQDGSFTTEPIVGSVDFKGTKGKFNQTGS